MPSQFHSELDMVPWYWEPFNLFEGVSDFARDNFFRLTEKRKYAKGARKAKLEEAYGKYIEEKA